MVVCLWGFFLRRTGVCLGFSVVASAYVVFGVGCVTACVKCVCCMIVVIMFNSLGMV